MKVIIMGFKDKSSWYSDKIGKTFQVVNDDIEDCIVKIDKQNKPARFMLVKKSDCQIVK